MKKFYVFAVAAAAVCMMASCGGNKSEKAAEGQEAEGQEIEVEGVENPLADEVLTEAKTLDASAFSLTAPAGWLVSSVDEESIDIMVPCQTGDCKDVNTRLSSSTIEESIETDSYDSFVEQEPVQINGLDYRVAKKEENHMTIYRVPVGEGHLGIYCQYCDIEDPDVKAILESVVLK